MIQHDSTMAVTGRSASYLSAAEHLLYPPPAPAAPGAGGGERHLPDGPPEMGGGTVESSVTASPIEIIEASIDPDGYSLLGRSLLSWNIPLISRGWSTPLTPQRLPQLRAHLAAPKIGSEITSLWADERTKPAPSLRRALVRLLRQQIIWGYSFGIVDGILSCVARPLVLRRLIQAIESEQPVDDGEGVLLLLMVTMT